MHVKVLIGALVGLTILGFAAIAVGRVLVPAMLFAAAVAVGLLGFAAFFARGLDLRWVPAGFLLTLPATLVLAIASAGQIKGQLDQRRRDRQLDRAVPSSDIRAP